MKVSCCYSVPWAYYSLPILGQEGLKTGSSKSNTTLNSGRLKQPSRDPSFFAADNYEDESDSEDPEKGKGKGRNVSVPAPPRRGRLYPRRHR